MFFAAVDIGASLQQGLDAFFAFIPRLIGFLIILLIGYIVARVVKTRRWPSCSTRSASTRPCIPVQSASTSNKVGARLQSVRG